MSGHMVKKEVTSEGEVGGQGDTCTFFKCWSGLAYINPFAALGRLTDQNIDKHLSIYSKSGINLIMMDRQP